MKAKYMHDFIRSTKKMSFFRCFVSMGGLVHLYFRTLDDALRQMTGENLFSPSSNDIFLLRLSEKERISQRWRIPIVMDCRLSQDKTHFEDRQREEKMTTTKRDWHHQVEHERRQFSPIFLFILFSFAFQYLRTKFTRRTMAKPFESNIANKTGWSTRSFPFSSSRSRTLFPSDDENLSKSKVESLADRRRTQSNLRHWTSSSSFVSHSNCRNGRNSATLPTIPRGSTPPPPKWMMKLWCNSSPTKKWEEKCRSDISLTVENLGW